MAPAPVSDAQVLQCRRVNYPVSPAGVWERSVERLSPEALCPSAWSAWIAPRPAALPLEGPESSSGSAWSPRGLERTGQDVPWSASGDGRVIALPIDSDGPETMC